MRVKHITFLLLLSLAATADYELTTEAVPSNHSPYRQRWIEDIHQTHEVWSIHNWHSFVSKMLGKNVSASDIEKINKAYQPQVGGEPSVDAAGVFSLFGKPSKPVAGHVIADDALIQSLSPETVRAVHAYTVDSGYFLNVLSPNFYGDIRPSLDGLDVSKETIEMLNKMMVKGLHNTAVPGTKANWKLLPYKLRERIVDRMFPARTVLSVTLKFKDAQDIHQIANDFAMGRDPELLKRFLNKKLSENQNRPVEIPLETILTPFIRDAINTYHLVGGANCSNAACAANAEKYYRQAYQSFGEFLTDLNTHFQPLADGDKRRAGDMMVFYDSDTKQPVHASIIINEQIVFTKNGQTRAAPYQFQNVADTITEYGAEIKYFRRAQPYQMQATPSLRKSARMLKNQNECHRFYSR